MFRTPTHPTDPPLAPPATPATSTTPATTWAVTLTGALAAVLVSTGCAVTTGPAAVMPSTASTASSTASPAVPEGAGAAGSAIAAENAKAGDPRWRLRERGAEHEIEGFADRVSVLPGGSFRLYVSTTAGRYTARAFRVGWYGGAGARQVWESAELPGVRQAPPRTIAATGAVSAAHWEPGPEVNTSGWPEGSYLIRLEAAGGGRRYVPITVRSASTRGRLVVVNAVTTWQAYNDWGGRSLYRGPGGFEDRSRAVSFDRPYDTSGARLFLDMERDAIEVAEHSGLPLAYVTSLELERDPGILDGARGLVSLGHDEYWSARMRRTVEAARDHGTNLAFLGANAVYWRIRFTATSLGPDRMVVCHKDTAEDPSTVLWRDSGEPENALTGPMYDCYPSESAYVVERPDNWIFKGTGVRRGTRFPGMAGVETDRVMAGAPRPMEVLSVSPVDCGGRSTVAHSAYYTVPSGAAVFDSGTMRWVCAMRGARCGHGVTRQAGAFVRRATRNLLRAFAAGPAGRRHPADDNLRSLGLDGPAPR
ncbi:N,N-dimethylformamidase beta subunit family domain-containing protein [Streptosporangium sp. CA-135522]|uniref:N,N-dimethylformamidase beta subunit family domain-containing protein n=1 Tax=Streptosporangium sp. CA-135522 TaxID=3240072 RepID=UPI003D926B7F